MEARPKPPRLYPSPVSAPLLAESMDKPLLEAHLLGGVISSGNGWANWRQVSAGANTQTRTGEVGAKSNHMGYLQ